MSRIPIIQSGITRYFDGPPPYETKKQWIKQGTRHDPEMRVYVRNQPVTIDEKWYRSIVIANLEVADHLQGQGYYRDFATWLEEFAASHHYIQAIYYEQVSSRDLGRTLQKHNYTRCWSYASAECSDDPQRDYYKWVKAEPSDCDIDLCEIGEFLSLNKSRKQN
ncbi:hypothetical protein [Microvirga massiliensis]|uniref:hypothetical protein n=1 Tax=Microvirga massiliensis TaxID=1033741 RepID=UPI00062B698A|nr:hypothetical protein [Microvirga massiliensis]